ncbi:hypothetical protein BO70DRAFT_383962 [Aspergillus heteromorphus CBS 117.55]|uniref:Uncharacterized protein n=1 Tax=Aspergillus heteromorphus CBS 117.55 TaxID=1448321 RepID=A0A317X473_9EURO|nr:uncharacterized protein BO70DRAFT_383962 [Aspergillus heteromorphus CBS 117.55]PWY92402.1 hypothetical protein BO70DRAFT_383962 [Aspergillus heteromorphus CBS 117.55]
MYPGVSLAMCHLTIDRILKKYMANNSSPDYRALYLEAEEQRRLAEKKEKQDLEREQTRPTSFGELIRYCHLFFLTAFENRSTISIDHENCSASQEQIYRSNAGFLFQPRLYLKALGDEFSERPISSEQDLESYERFCVENHVRDIIAKLCTINAARDEFRLGKDIQFDNHANALDTNEEDKYGKDKSTGSRRSRPDQFCVHRVDGENKALLMTVEYKSSHKLSVENLRAGLRPMDLWHEVVRPDSVPTEGPEKLKYNAAWLTGSAVVQEYHVMIQEGLDARNRIRYSSR